MIRVYVVVEGQTEEAFVNEVLSPFLWRHEVCPTPILLGHRGGNPSYSRLRKDVLLLLKQDRSCYCSTMLDFYGLGTGFPGMPTPANMGGLDKVIRVERAVKEDVVAEVPDLRPDIRFLPYLQLHEYEGLLFSDTTAFASGIGQPHLGPRFQQIRASFATPEDINDEPRTAPSKRVLDAFPPYRKVLHGTLAALAIGIERMRQECNHFHHWVEQLEALGN